MVASRNKIESTPSVSRYEGSRAPPANDTFVSEDYRTSKRCYEKFSARKLKQQCSNISSEENTRNQNENSAQQDENCDKRPSYAMLKVYKCTTTRWLCRDRSRARLPVCETRHTTDLTRLAPNSWRCPVRGLLHGMPRPARFVRAGPAGPARGPHLPSESCHWKGRAGWPLARAYH